MYPSYSDKRGRYRRGCCQGKLLCSLSPQWHRTFLQGNSAPRPWHCCRCLQYCWLGSKFGRYADVTKEYKAILYYRVKDTCQIIFLWHSLPHHEIKAPASLTEPSLHSAAPGSPPCPTFSSLLVLESSVSCTRAIPHAWCRRADLGLWSA